MKINMQKFARVFAPFIACSMLILCMAVPASAAILDPYENGAVSIDGNLEVVSVKLDTSNMFWQRFHNGTASYNGTGSDLTYTTEMRYVDNDTVSCWPFGVTTYILTGGIPTGSNISADMAIGVNIENQSQIFECVGYLYLDTYDSLGRSIARTTVWTETQSNVDGSLVFFVDPDIGTAALQGSYQWSLTFSFDFNGVSNENDTTSVTLQCFGENISLEIPYSQLYQLQQQGEKTNQLLDQIDKQMAANGEKLDQIMNGSQADQDAANDFENNSSNQGGQLDDANDALNDVTKPDPDDIPMDVGDYIPPDGSRAFSDLLAPVYASPVMYTPLLIAVVFLVLRFVLFGKAR